MTKNINPLQAGDRFASSYRGKDNKRIWNELVSYETINSEVGTCWVKYLGGNRPKTLDQWANLIGWGKLKSVS